MGQSINVFLPPNTFYTLYVYDPNTNKWGESSGTTGSQGASTLAPCYVDIDPGPIQTDGLPIAATYIIGTNPNFVSTTGDGISDGLKVQEDINPLGNYSNVTGVLAQVPLQGEAQDVVLEGSILSAQGQTAYAATGSYGLAIVNVTQFQQPVTLGQLQLTGDSTSVDVDPNWQIGAVASNAGGLNLIDVSNPDNPQLLQKIAVNASLVKVDDGVAYAAVGGDLISFDLLTGEELQDLNISSGTLTALAHEGSFLYTVDSNNTLQVIDISGPLMVARGSVALPADVTFASGSDALSVGNGIAYVPVTRYLNTNGLGALSGYLTADVSNPDSPAYLNDLPTADSAGQAIALNGSGLALTVGSDLNGPAVNVFDASNTSTSGQFLTRFDLPEDANDVAIGEGIAFVADGGSALQVVNYEPFDTKGIPPTASISLPSSAIVGTSNGTPQVIEGSLVPILANVHDDVQVRNVELLINGLVVQNDVSFPFNLSTILPTIKQLGSNTATIQLRAADTGGNVGLWNVLTIQLVKDTFPPKLLDSNVPNNGTVYDKVFHAITLDFSKPLDESTVTASNFQLIGPNGNVVPWQSIQFRRNGETVELMVPTLADGNYQFVINAPAVTDRPGNPLGSSKITTTFHVAQYSATWINPNGGDWNTASNWLAGVVPQPGDDVLINVPGNAAITFSSGTASIHSLHSMNPFTISGGTFQVADTLEVDNTFTLRGGTLQDAHVLKGSNGQGITISGTPTLDGVRLDADVDMTQTDFATMTVLNGLTFNGTARIGGFGNQLLFNGNQSLVGKGDIQLGGNSLTAGDSSTLTLGSNITVEGAGTLSGQIVNDGTVTADTPGQTLSIDASSFTNQGILQVQGGSLSLTNFTGNLGGIALGGAGGALSVDGTNYTVDSSFNLTNGQSLSLLGSWTAGSGVSIYADGATIGLGTRGDSTQVWSSASTINAVNSTVNLGGSTTSLGALALSSSTLNVVGNYTTAQVQPLLGNSDKLAVGTGGVLDNTNNTIALDATTGSLTLAGGTLKGGAVSASGGADVVVTGSGSVFDGVTLNSDLDMTAANAQATVLDGLTLNGTARIGNPNDVTGANFTFSDTQTLSGTGTILFGQDYPSSTPSVNKLMVNSGSTLTIGSGITITGSSGTVGGSFSFSSGSVVNQGVISAGSGDSIMVNASTFTNSGKLQVSGGGSLSVSAFSAVLGSISLTGNNSSLTLSGSNYTVDSSFSISNGQTLNLAGSWTAATGVTINAAGAAVGVGSTTSLSAISLSNSALTLLASYTYAQVQPLLGKTNRLVVGQNGILDNSGNTITLTGSSQILALSGGTLKGGTVTASSGAKVVVTSGSLSFLDGVTLNSDLDLTATSAAAWITDGLTLNGTVRIGDPNNLTGATLIFAGTQTLTGNGTILFGKGYSFSFGGSTSFANELGVATGTTLTIGSGITITGVSGDVANSLGQNSVINQGTISADSGDSIAVSVDSFTNAGKLQASGGGSLSVSGLSAGLGNVSIAGNNSTLGFSGTNYTVDSSFSISNGQTLNLGGSWTTASGVTIKANGATLGLGTTSSLSAITLTSSTLNVLGDYTYAQLQPLLTTGNKLAIGSGGVLGNKGNTLTLNAATGSLTLDGGTLQGGTVSASGGAEVVATSFGGYLDGVTLNSNLNVTAANASAAVLDGLTLNGTASIGDANGNSIATLSFSGNQILAGNGTILFGKGVTSSSGLQANLMAVAAGSTLTIGSGITVTGTAGAIGSSSSTSLSNAAVNQGTITAAAGDSIALNVLLLTNQGTAQASGGGSLNITGTASNSGTVSAGAGSAVNVTGSFIQNGGTVGIDIAGTGSSQIGVLNISGIASLGGTLDVSFVNGFVPFAGDTFKVMTFGSRSGSFGSIVSHGLPSGLTLNAVYDSGDLTLKTS